MSGYRAGTRRGAAIAAVAILLTGPALAGGRIVSLDQCADQYALALAPRADIVGLSKRARQADSALRDHAAGLREVRPDLESLLALRPSVVLRTWGGDGVLLAALARRGARVVTLPDPADFADIRANIRTAAAALGAPDAGRSLIQRLNRQLAGAAGAGRGEAALYLTAGGATAGPDTLMGALLRAAGYRDAEPRPGYRSVPLESLILHPPARVVTGFFDADPALARWGLGRQAALVRLLDLRGVVTLPAALLACPCWTLGEAAARLAAAARRA